MYAGSRRKGDDNPQRGNALKLSTAHIKEKRKRKEIREKWWGGGRCVEKHAATRAAAGQEIANAACKSLL